MLSCPAALAVTSEPMTDCHKSWNYDRANYVHSTYALFNTLPPVIRKWQTFERLR
jgi:hypothetical protein